MIANSEYNLLNIIRIIKKEKKKILFITISAGIIGALLHLVMPKKYEAATVFILKNPLYADRNNLYNNETKFLDYVANDEDISRFITMASDSGVQQKIISDMHLAAIYGYDTTGPEGRYKLKKAFQNRLKIYVNEYKNVVLNYTDSDPVRAAVIANLCTELLEHSLRGFYNGMRKNMQSSIQKRVVEEDSAIAVLTDTLTQLREQYGIYDIISPSRNNLMLSEMKENGHAGYARGIEQVQNIESIKDELVSDRAKHISLANQYATGTEIYEMQLTHIIEKAIPPYKPKGAGIVLTTIISAFLGWCFSLIYIMASEGKKQKNANAKNISRD